MNKNYQRGVRFERELVKKFKASYYKIVTRAAGSHSFADVIAISNTGPYMPHIRVIQCKVKKSKGIKPIEIDNIYSGPATIAIEKQTKFVK